MNDGLVQTTDEEEKSVDSALVDSDAENEPVVDLLREWCAEPVPGQDAESDSHSEEDEVDEVDVAVDAFLACGGGSVEYLQRFLNHRQIKPMFQQIESIHRLDTAARALLNTSNSLIRTHSKRSWWRSCRESKLECSGLCRTSWGWVASA
jgi:hypothetical protein